jgi:uncharacterized RDD family membrane protein YckC
MHTEMNTPGLWRRMACWLYEGILLFGVVLLADYLFSALTQTRNAMDNRGGQQAFVFVIFGIYFVWFWSKGQTLAMKTWNIRLVDRRGAPVTQARALLRYCLSWLWVIPPLAVVSFFHLAVIELPVLLIGWVSIWALLSRFQREGQFWHDAWSGTRLISSQPLSR